MAQTTYTGAITYTVDLYVAGDDPDAMDALLDPYVWGTVEEARRTVYSMVTVNRFPYNRYETREGTVYAFHEGGNVTTAVFLERRERIAQAVARAARPQPSAQAWSGYSPSWKAGMTVNVYQDALTGMWCTLVRVWNTDTMVLATDDTEWHDSYTAAHARYSTLTAHYTGFNGR